MSDKAPMPPTEMPLIICPFCHDPDFDEIGLKTHLVRGWCGVYDTIMTVDEWLARTPKEPS